MTRLTDKKKGMVYLVGAGPGDPGLVTLKAVQLMAGADVVVYDHLVDEAILSHAARRARIIYAGKEGGRHTLSQDEINRLIVAEAKEGRRVVRLKGGDPFIFGRGGEEALELAAEEIPFEVVPGVTSASAVPAYAGIPVTHRGRASMVVFVTGHEDPTKEADSVDWEYLAGFPGTIVVLMGVKRIEENVNALISGGKSPDTPCALISRGTTPAQKSVRARLADIGTAARQKGVTAPAVLVVGEVADLMEHLAWFEKLPLFGRRIIVTRARHQAAELSDRLRALGALPIQLPTIQIVPPEDEQAAERAVSSLSAYDIAVFTSPNGVEAFFERLGRQGRDSRVLGGLTVAAMGPGTALSLRNYGIAADIVPDRFIAEALAEALITAGVSGKNILLFRAQGARDVLPRLLTEAGAGVTDAGAYRAAVPDITDEQLVRAFEGADLMVFTSGSTATNLGLILDEKKKKGTVDLSTITSVPAASIGPITTEAAVKAGFSVVAEATDYTVGGLVDALVEYYSDKT
ncbi:MAG: uroporphyrinogen-III C-methyltransferase [Deltaproteobacteria bacterium]|nr:uroporphyrinogen-III C-methyltransferase [Candidatus Zymogenaceae bacterium]